MGTQYQRTKTVEALMFGVWVPGRVQNWGKKEKEIKVQRIRGPVKILSKVLPRESIHQESEGKGRCHISAWAGSLLLGRRKR